MTIKRVLKNILDAILLTIQFRTFSAYSMYKKEQKRREDELEPPAEIGWAFMVQKFIWDWEHRFHTGKTSNAVVKLYSDLFDHMCVHFEATSNSEIKDSETSVRISGQTIVINNVWAINPSVNGGIYVHHRHSEERDWALVYRTYWKRDDARFIYMMEVALRLARFRSGRDGAPEAVGTLLDKENPLDATIDTLPN